jgi:hypothetical protein
VLRTKKGHGSQESLVRTWAKWRDAFAFLHTRKRVPPPFAFAHTHTKDKLALGELCSGEAAYFKPSGTEIVPATANAPIPLVSVR